MKKEVAKEEIIKIEDLFQTIKKRWITVVAITIIFAIVTMIFNFFILAPQYQTEAKIFVGKQATEQKELTYNDSEVSMYQSLMKTYAEVIQTKDLISQALVKINQSNDYKNINNVDKSLAVTTLVNTQVLNVTYTTTDKANAVPILNSILNQFKFEATSLIPNVNIQVIEKPQTPINPVGPHKVRNTVIGAFIGLILSLIVIFSLEYFDNTIKSGRELEDLLDLPVIGSIPYDEKL